MDIKRCVFCNMKDNFKDEQLLYKGSYFYLVVPRGQIIEGYMIISSYSCREEDNGLNSLVHASDARFNELKKIIKLAIEFYKFAYDINCLSYYEQGRGATGKKVDELNNFPIHSHVCLLPSEYNFQKYMHDNYKEILLTKIENIRQINDSYLLLSYIRDNRERICAYIGKDLDQEIELSHFRFKKIIANLLNCPEKEQWRMCVATDEILIRKVIQKYNEFKIHANI